MSHGVRMECHQPPVLGPTQSPIQWVQGALSLGVKRPGREADPPSWKKKFLSPLNICFNHDVGSNITRFLFWAVHQVTFRFAPWLTFHQPVDVTTESCHSSLKHFTQN
jgi:hypothetical protein